MTDTDSLELKKRSRRRLVGAAALALLAAIVLPMVMDQEPSPPAQDIQVTIPDRDADSLLARPIAGRPPQLAEPQLAPPPEEQPPAASSEAPAVAATPTPESDAPARVEPPAPRVEAVPKPQKPEAPAKAEAPAKPVAEAKPPAAPDEAARVRALLEGQPGTTVRRDESFVVQVGAFGESDSAASLSSELKRLGYTAYTEKAGQVTRVRIGPFATREQAEKVAARLHASGHKGVVATR